MPVMTRERVKGSAVSINTTKRFLISVQQECRDADIHMRLFDRTRFTVRLDLLSLHDPRARIGPTIVLDADRAAARPQSILFERSMLTGRRT
jgi:hypothetical protein